MKKHYNMKMSVEINKSKDYIILHHKLSGTDWIVNRTRATEAVLTTSKCTHFSFEKGNRRLRVLLSYNGKLKPYRPYFAPFIYACYHNGTIPKRLHSDTNSIIRLWGKNDVIVDHLDDNKFNNTVCNLSHMTRTQNSRKGKRVSKFKGIFKLLLAYDGKYYRGQLAYIDNMLKGTMHALNYYCDTADALIDMLESLYQRKMQIRQNKIGAIADSRLYSVVGNAFFTKRIRLNIDGYAAQQILVDMPLDNFVRWEEK